MQLNDGEDGLQKYHEATKWMQDASAEFANTAEEDEAVKYVDTDGDTIVFRRKATGKLDCDVNGVPEFIDLISLKLHNGTIYFDGTKASKSRATSAGRIFTRPVNSSDAERVLALYRGTLRVTPFEYRPL